jgi:hypothetical protein
VSVLQLHREAAAVPFAKPHQHVYRRMARAICHASAIFVAPIPLGHVRFATCTESTQHSISYTHQSIAHFNALSPLPPLFQD